MKLPIKKEYFDEIKAGKKTVDFRDAHITFICEETGEKLVKVVKGVKLVAYGKIPKELQKTTLFGDSMIIKFDLETR